MKLSYYIVIAFLIFPAFSQKLDSIEELINKQEYISVINNYLIYETKISSYPEINYYLAIAYFKTGNYTKAEQIFSELANQGYKLAQTYFNLGVTKYKLKKFKEAIDYLKTAMNHDITLSAECMYIMISCYLKQDDKDKAIEVYRELNQNFPSSIQLVKSQELLESYKINTKKIALYQPAKVNFYISAEYGYDSNVNMVSLQQLSGNSDNYYGVMLNISLNYRQLILMSTFEKVLLSSFTNYNSDIYNVTLQYNSDKISLDIFGKYLIYEQPLVYGFGTELKFSLQPLVLKLLYSNRIYLNTPELNTTTYQTTAEINYHNNRTVKLSPDITVKREILESMFSYYSIAPSIKYSQKIFKFLTVNTRLNYELKQYDWPREDKIFNFNFSLSITPVKNLEFLPSLLYTDASSNQEYLSYKKTEVTVSLNLYF